MMLAAWSWCPVSLNAGEAYRYSFREAENLFRADGLAFRVTPAATNRSLRVTLLPLQNGRPEFIEKASAEALIPAGCGVVEIPFALFDNRQRVRAHLKYIQAVEVSVPEDGERVELLSAGPLRVGDLLVSCDRTTRTGAAGETLAWTLKLQNGLDKARCITLHADVDGREVLAWHYPTVVELPPCGEGQIELQAVMSAEMPEGGVEKRAFTLMADGCMAQTITLYAARKQPKPFLLHTEAGWNELRRAVETDESVRSAFQKEYIALADAWQVEPPATHHRFVYTNFSHDKLLHTVIAWKVTGNPAYLDKAMTWYRGYLDDENGYLATKYCYFEFPKKPEEAPKDKFLVHHANSAGWVQEGEFMARMAIAYDLIRGESCFTPEMHAKMEACMRAYMDFVDWRQTDGDGNNFQICEAGGALYFALLLQDEELIVRFLEGSNGLQELVGSVFADDGSYFEGATGYMRLAAEVFGRAAVSCQNAGRNLKDALVPAAFERNVMHSPWSHLEETAPDGKPFLGMSFERFDPVRRPVRTLKDYYDCLMQLMDDRGVIFSANDSNEHAFARVMQLAYYLYHDPAYLPYARQGAPDPIFGLHMTPLGVTKRETGLHMNNGNGFAVLREKTEQSPVQAVMKFGQHGGYHGHFDRLSLLSVMRDGATFHNNEYAWFGYGSFLFKMWVQTSVAHNMVVVDGRMQEPTPCEIILQQEEEGFQAVCAQTTSRWCDPPYGGQTPYLAQFPYEKCPQEKHWILDPGTPRPQGSIGEYSDPVFQRRLVVLANGCCFVWDYLEAEQEHTFDCLYHPLGSLNGELPALQEHTARFNRDPFGAGQFIMNCHHYDLDGSVRLHFANDRKRVNGNDMVDFAANSTLFSVYPPKQRMIIGRYPEGKDTYEHEEDYQSPDMLQSGCKKTVAFRQTGKSAVFITALEIGQTPSDIVSVTAESFETIRIRRADGSEKLLSVTGMQAKDTKEITVRYTAG